ncbi:phage portal protein [Microbulbifer thermotolerans]|uniref:phage portal protein n=1 Tax=Microbulbifer thermotolerans TaxID=252514 RepID=UPI00267124EC|nr:phage portal protein [Microbulbifer thermotolerans]WKT59116.1 phage portal protein [Microbulbifer thermotolerans]
MTAKRKPGRIKAAILNWLGVPSIYAGGHGGIGSEAAGQLVNDRTVLSLSAVWACARLISETIATLPIGIYRKDTVGRIAETEHPVYQIIRSRPNANSTASVYWEAMVAAMLLRGNGISEKKYLGNRLVALEFLAPWRLSISCQNGVRRYLYTDANGRQRHIPNDRIFRIPGFTLDGDWGLSAIEFGSNVFGSALAAANAANSTFERGLAPTVAFTMEKVLKKEQREEFRKNLKAISGALNAGESPLLEGGMDAKQIGIKPSDAQLLESRAFSVEEICRWFRVPPFMVGHSEKSTSWGTGIEQQMIGFLTFTLRPWLARIEQAINKDLLSPADQMRYYAEFNVEGLLRADSAGRAAFLEKMVGAGLMTRDEGRAKENLPPKGGNADVLMANSANQPIDTLGANNAN